jgi:purine-binding chemotaxis protein CheW
MSDLVPSEAVPHSLRATRGENGMAELLAFICNDELYAVDLRAVHEIVIPPPITIVPRSPFAVVGVCSVRGQLATVVELRRILGIPPADESKKGRILLARTGETDLVGLMVDEVRHVVRLSSSQLEYSAQSLGGDISEGVRGVGRPATGEVIVILDLLAMLNKGCS